MDTVQSNSTVSIEYTLKVDGEIVDQSRGRGPLEFRTGAGQVIQGMEEGVLGMRLGETKHLHILPDKGYGPRVEEMVKVIPKDMLKKKEGLDTGARVTVGTGSGNRYTGTVIKMLPDAFVVDFNHPLAGKTLEFEVRVVGIK